MKVLRIRRGFTTNSSGANEYLPAKSRKDGGRTDGAHAATPAPGAVSKAQPGAKGSQAVAVPGQPAPGPVSNAHTLALLGIGVVLLFITERAARLVLRRRRKRHDDSTPPTPPPTTPSGTPPTTAGE